MKPKTARLIVTILLAAIVALCVIVLFLPVGIRPYLAALIILLMIPYFVTLICFLKCPHCGKQVRPYLQKYCAHCGKQVEWDRTGRRDEL